MLVKTEPKKFIITGCGRSGTTYIANLLTSMGCRCSHEEYFPKRLPKLIYLPQFYQHCFVPYYKRFKLQWPTRHHGEAAWQAAPFLELLPEDVVILHQVRHPLDFVKSRQKKGVVYGRLRSMFTQVEHYQTKQDFSKLPLERQVDYLARFWVEWNQLVEKNVGQRRYLRYRLEDIDLSLLDKILYSINYYCDSDTLKHAYETVSKKTNTRGSTEDEITFDMLSPDVYSRVRELAEKYGYQNV